MCLHARSQRNDRLYLFYPTGIIVDMTPFLNLIVGETADSAINVQTEVEDDFLEILNSDSRTEKVYLYNSLNVSHVGGVELMATLCDDFSKVNNQSADKQIQNKCNYYRRKNKDCDYYYRHKRNIFSLR